MRKKEKDQTAFSGMASIAAAAVLLLTLAAGLVSYRIQNREEGIVLRFGMCAESYWGVPVGNCYQIVDEAIARFEKEHPGVRVEYTSGIRQDAYAEWLAEQVLLGTEPDVFMIPRGEFDTLAGLGILQELDGMIAEDGGFSGEAYYPGAYEYGNIFRKQYALPYESVPMLMFVNKELLEAEGISMPKDNWTRSDFLDICRRVTKDTDGDGILDQFGCYDYSWKDAVYANGAALFDADGTGAFFYDERVEEALRFVQELNRLNGGFSVTSREFDLGKVAFMPLAYSEYRTYKPYPWRIKKYSDFEWDCVKMPAGQAGESRTELDTLLMGIGSRSRRKELAWEFLKWLCYEGETQRQLLEDSQGVPVVKKAVQDYSAGDTGQMDLPVLDQVMGEAVAAPHFGKYPEAVKRADSEVDRILSGEVSMDSGLLKLQREMMAFLKE